MHTFKKSSIIKVTLRDGSTILARITRLCGFTGKVNFRDIDGRWSGSMPSRMVVVATPAEIAAHAAQREAKYAPVDPIMARWSLGRTKRGPAMREGHYYAADILRDGRKVGQIVDDGSGGPTTARCKAREDEVAFNDECRTWAITNGAPEPCYEPASLFWSWWQDGRESGVDARAYIADYYAPMRKAGLIDAPKS